MAPDQFLEWINKEIETNETLGDREDCKMEPNLYYRGKQYAFEEVREKFLTLTPPLPSWITDKGDGRYTIDVKAAMAAGEELPIKLYKIPQFAPFFTNPPTQRGTIEFENYHQLIDKK